MAQLLSGWFKYNVGDAAFFSVFGLLFVVLGIVLLVLILTAFGKIMQLIASKKKNTASVPPVAPAAEGKQEEEISPETLAVITAAVAAIYAGEETKCSFVVRRIKRI